jgi:hypothetical protein
MIFIQIFIGSIELIRNYVFINKKALLTVKNNKDILFSKKIIFYFY